MRSIGLLTSAPPSRRCSSARCRDETALNELRDQQRQILAKLTALEEKIDKAARPSRRRAAAADRPGSGPRLQPAGRQVAGQGTRADAPITIVEFSDYQCPFCARSEPLVHEALAAYPTQARLVFKHYPLTSIHPQAMPAALAAAAAQKQGKFWEMHEKLFANQRALAPEQLTQYARELGLDMKQFETDMQSDEVKALVQEDIAAGPARRRARHADDLRQRQDPAAALARRLQADHRSDPQGGRRGARGRSAQGLVRALRADCRPFSPLLGQSHGRGGVWELS